MNMLFLKSFLPFAASSVVMVSLASCDRKGEPDSFNVRGVEPGVGPTKSTGGGRPIYPEPPVPGENAAGSGAGTSGGVGSGTGGTSGGGAPADPQKPSEEKPGENPATK